MSTHSGGRIGVVGIVCLSALLVPAGILIVFLVASLLLSGAQVTADGSAQWDAVIPFPVFPVPAWLLTALAVVALASAVVWALRASPADASALTGAVGPAVAGAFASGFFLFAFADDGALAGEYVLPLTISAVTVVVLFVAAVIHGARDRAVSDDRLPEGRP